MLTVIVGPPCAGKTTYVRENAKAGDLVVDLDRIASALSIEGADDHDFPSHVLNVAIGARYGALKRLGPHLLAGVDAWIIHTDPSARSLREYRSLNARIVILEPEIDVVLERAKTSRPASTITAIHDYYRRKRTYVSAQS